MGNSSIMFKMTARDIAKNFLQYLSMIIINMLAVTLFCGFVSNAATLDKTLKNYYSESNLTDLICQYSLVKQEDMDFLNSLGADKIEYRFYSEGSENQKSAKIYVCRPDNQISLPLISQGTRGVLVDKHVAERDSLNIGSEIEIEWVLGAAKLQITGIMNFAEVANTYAYSPVYLDSDIVSQAFPFFTAENYANQALIKTNSPELIKEALSTHYNNAAGSGLIFVYDRDSMESVVMLNNEVSQTLKMIYVFPVIFLLVSVLVILSTIAPLILRQRTNIGTLKGIGISNKKILFHYAFFGTVLCFIGGVTGIIIGPFIVPNVMLVKYNLVYSIPKFASIVFSPLWSAVAVAAVCALAALIGFAVCRKTVREKPAACMRPLPPKNNIILRKTGADSGKSKPRNIPAKMALRNIILKPSRALMTIIGVAGCVALLVCSFGIGDTVNNSIDLELGRQFKYDISTTYTKEAEDSFLHEMENLKAQGRIDYFESYKIFYMSARGESIKDVKIFVLPQNPELTEINPNGRTLITKSVAEDLKIKEGEAVTLTSAGKSYNLVIDEIIETSYTKGIFISETDAFEGNFYSPGMWIRASDPADSLVEHINMYNGTKGAFTMSEMHSDVNTAISSISTIKFTLMLFAVALSVVVLYNLSLLNIKERSRDIATMKVLGFTRGQISLSLVYEIMLLVILGTVLGLLLGYPINYLVLSINRIEVLTFIYHIKPLSYLISAGISIITALTINLLFARQIEKINMIESLKSVE